MEYERDATWPAVRYEPYPWKFSDPDYISKRQKAKHVGSYQAAVPPLIASLDMPSPSSVILQLVHDASVEMAAFDQQYSTQILPYASLFLRSEAAASSQIENLTSSAKAVSIAEVSSAAANANSIVIASNVQAMKTAIGVADRLDVDNIVAIHRALMQKSRPQIAGKIRIQQVWIGGSSVGPHNADFVPPHHDRIAACFDDLAAYIGRNDIPPLMQAAISHAQFETIHPFVDGNGRTGRALLHAVLAAKGLTEHASIPLSAGLLGRTDEYSFALTVYREGDPFPIIKLFCEAVLESVTQARRFAAEITEVRGIWFETAKVRKGSAANVLLEALIQHPAVNAELVQKITGVNASNALLAIKKLVDYGVLEPASANARNRIWVAPAILAALEDFAQRSQRRRY